MRQLFPSRWAHRATAVATVVALSLGGALVAAAPASAATETPQIPVAELPLGVTTSRDGTKLYVVSSTTPTLTVIDAESQTVVKTVPTYWNPRHVVVNPVKDVFYISHMYNAVTAVDANSYETLATIPVEWGTEFMAVTPDGETLYTVNSASNTVSVIDTSSNTIVKTIPIGGDANGIAADADAVYVAIGASKSVSIIETQSQSIAGSISLANVPGDIVLHPTRNSIYVAERYRNAVLEIDRSTLAVVQQIDLSCQSEEFRLAPNGKTLYTSGRSAGCLRALDTETNTVTWSMSDDINLPNGLAVVDSGVEKVFVTNERWNSVSVFGGAELSTQSLESGVTALPYSAAVVATGSPTLRYAIKAGTLPIGLTLDAATGLISGTPIAAGSWPITLSATNGIGRAATADFTVSVTMAAYPALTSGTPSSATAGAPYSDVITATGRPAPTLAIDPAELPEGLTFDPATGELSGTTHDVGEHSFTVTATNVLGTASQELTLTVNGIAPAFTSLDPAAVPAGLEYTHTFTATGFPVPRFTITGGSLPDGLNLNEDTGTISGTSFAVGDHAITVTASNGTEPDARESYTLTVTGVGPVITSGAPKPITAGLPYEHTITGSGIPALSFELTAGALPEGLTLSPTSGTISGTTFTVGSYDITVRASNSAGSVDLAYPLTVVAQKFTASPTPTISGTARAGQTLTATAGSWKPSSAALTYQWNVAGKAITGATASTYKVATADAGKAITVSVTGTQPGFTTVAKTSTSVTVEKPLTASPTPTISGTAKAGQTLTAKTWTWAPATVALSYQWNVSGKAIKGATTSSYTVATADAGKSLTVTVTGKKTGYTSVVKTSKAVTVQKPLTATPTPTISGTVKAGQTLTAKAWTWSPKTVTLGYQWNRAGVAITGATKSTYTIVAADAGKAITVTVTGKKTGYTSVAKTSKSVTLAAKKLTASPTPTISGTVKAGQTLTAKAGTWGPKPVTLSYQWKRSGVAISGATKASYTIVAADAGKAIAVTVTGKKDWYASAAKTSKAVTLAAKKLTAAPTPTISGTAKVGQTLTARAGSWAPAKVTLSYQWKRSGQSISGANTTAYKLTKADAGKAITVTVTGKKDWYATTAKISKAVTPK